jgi:hypothetical protein
MIFLLPDPAWAKFLDVEPDSENFGPKTLIISDFIAYDQTSNARASSII